MRALMVTNLKAETKRRHMESVTTIFEISDQRGGREARGKGERVGRRAWMDEEDTEYFGSRRLGVLAVEAVCLAYTSRYQDGMKSRLL